MFGHIPIPHFSSLHTTIMLTMIYPLINCESMYCLWRVEKAIRELEMKGQKPAALFIISPTYQGICSNLREISLMCHLNGIPLIVDEAHGAHFGFYPRLPVPALQQGADIVVQSTHKVLCSLTQSSMLHLSGNIVARENICKCLRTLQSTSASALLLASLDVATARLRENPKKIFWQPNSFGNGS